MLRWTCSAVFTVVLVCMSLLMMCKLRIRFSDFYADYGCFLWAVVIIQALSLLFWATTDALYDFKEDAVDNFYYDINDAT